MADQANEKIEITPEMIESGASVARLMIDCEWSAYPREQQHEILSAIYIAMRRSARVELNAQAHIKER